MMESVDQLPKQLGVLLRQPHPAYQVGVARIGADAVKIRVRFNKNQISLSLRVSLIEVFKSAIRLTKHRIIVRKLSFLSMTRHTPVPPAPHTVLLISTPHSCYLVTSSA